MRVGEAGFGFGAVAVRPALRVRPFPAQHAERGRAVGRLKNPQPQHLVAGGELTVPIEAPVQHGPAELEPGARALQGATHGVGVLDPSLDFQFVQWSGIARAHQAKMASSTASVSTSVANTRAAPAARRAATS